MSARFAIGERVTLPGRKPRHGVVTRLGCDAGPGCRWAPDQCFTVRFDGSSTTENPNPATLTPEVPRD